MDIITELSDGYKIRSLSGEDGLKLTCAICENPLFISILTEPTMDEDERVTRLAVAICGTGYDKAMSLCKIALPQLSSEAGVCTSSSFKGESFKYFALAAESIVKNTVFFSQSLMTIRADT